jgi:glutamate formiminotransferase/formiminotetrahydrofolate cyclodeaminase
MLKCVKGIGWFIEEYGVAQISMNLTNISVTPVHVAFDECASRPPSAACASPAPSWSG